MRPGPLHFTGEAPVRPSATRVLLVEDNAGDVELARARLSDVPGHEFVVSHVATLTGALDALIDGVDGFDIVIVDLDLPDARGLDTLVRVRAVAGDVPVVVFTGRREAALFEQLYAQAHSPEVQCRVHWREGDIVFFDNRSTQHYAVPDYTERRVMHRTTIVGNEPPIAA